jgi:hypothetical protein
MADDSAQSYYQTAKGTIAGFDGRSVPSDDPTLSQVGWSIDQIRRFLLNESGTNFPTAERVDEIEELIIKHINDTNNPHGVSVDAITQDVSAKILAGFVPGTPPSTTPFFAYDAANPLPMDTVFPATFSSSNFYRMVEGGRLVNPATESDQLATDASNGLSGLPLYAGFANLVPNTWPTSVSLPVNTRVTQISNPSVTYPFDFYRVDETNATGDFGVAIPAQLVVSQVYTFTIFLQPLYAGGYFAIKQPGNDQAVMLVNSDTGGFVLGSDSIQGSVVVYPSGVMRVSYSFVATADGLSRIQVLHRRTVDREIARIGHVNQVLFLMGQPMISLAPLGAPIPIDSSAAATNSPLVPRLSSLGVPASMSRVMISLTMLFRKQLPAIAMNDTQVLQFGGLTMTRDAVNVYVRLDGNVLFTSPIVDGINTFSISYSPTEILFKDLLNAKQKVIGSYAALNTSNARVGPCAGHLRQWIMYPENDRAQCLEFLTNA